MAHLIATRQLPDGRFQAVPMRPPLESSDFTATALSLRALQLYGKEPEDRVARASQWLRNSRPRTTEDRVMQLLGMGWSNAGADDLRKGAAALLAEQRPDGGWAQLSAIESDAYATGQALVALNWAGQLKTTDPAYQRGVAFLLRTQSSDGSWLVRTRAFPIQAVPGERVSTRQTSVDFRRGQQLGRDGLDPWRASVRAAGFKIVLIDCRGASGRARSYSRQ
jgi:hypothetical protein